MSRASGVPSASVLSHPIGAWGSRELSAHSLLLLSLKRGRAFLLKLLSPGLGKAGLDRVARAVGHLPSSCPNQGEVAKILQDSKC